MAEIVEECNEMHRVCEDCERMDDDIDSHGVAMQDSTYNVFIAF